MIDILKPAGWRIVSLTAIMTIGVLLAYALSLGHDGYMTSIGVGAIASIATGIPIYILGRNHRKRGEENE